MESKNKWRDRFNGAWQILIGTAYASYYANDPQEKFQSTIIYRQGIDSPEVLNAVANGSFFSDPNMKD